MRDPRYDVLFQPMAIGPVVAKNRFYQVPHCNGGGYRDPSAAAEMRGIKAEGGWGVIFTEQTEMHHTSEIKSTLTTTTSRAPSTGCARTSGIARPQSGTLASGYATM